MPKMVHVLFSLSGGDYETLTLLNIISIMESSHFWFTFHFIDSPSLSPLFKEKISSLSLIYNFKINFHQYKWPSALYKDF